VAELGAASLAQLPSATILVQSGDFVPTKEKKKDEAKEECQI
jgi:hypothetical protein